MPPPILRSSLAVRLAAAACALSPLATASLPGSSLAAAVPSRIDPTAMARAKEMGQYLRTLRTFRVTSDAVTEFVDAHGRKVPVATHVVYRVRRPNGFVIDLTGEHKVRRFIYDGRTFTVFAPKVAYFATVPAPPTIEATVERIYSNNGIVLPLADLFYWGTAAQPGDRVTAASRLGSEQVAGVMADHYAYAGAGLRWEVWIARGPEPLPLRMRIVTTSDPARPAYTANLAWNPRATFAPGVFTFSPPPQARPIALARVAP